jgi:hypothetical protein
MGSAGILPASLQLHHSRRDAGATRRRAIERKLVFSALHRTFAGSQSIRQLTAAWSPGKNKEH